MRSKISLARSPHHSTPPHNALSEILAADAAPYSCVPARGITTLIKSALHNNSSTLHACDETVTAPPAVTVAKCDAAA